MYILFEYIEDYENPKTNIICITEYKIMIEEYLSKLKFNRILHFEDRSIYEQEDKDYIIIYSKTNKCQKQEVVLWNA